MSMSSDIVSPESDNLVVEQSSTDAGVKILNVMDKLGFDVEGACGEFLGFECYQTCSTGDGYDSACNNISTGGYCNGAYCCNEIGATCQ